jgi:hypothetical protein
MTLFKQSMLNGRLVFERTEAVESTSQAKVKANACGTGHYVVVQGDEPPTGLEDPYIVGRVIVFPDSNRQSVGYDNKM